MQLWDIWGDSVLTLRCSPEDQLIRFAPSMQGAMCAKGVSRFNSCEATEGQNFRLLFVLRVGLLPILMKPDRSGLTRLLSNQQTLGWLWNNNSVLDLPHPVSHNTAKNSFVDNVTKKIC